MNKDLLKKIKATFEELERDGYLPKVDRDAVYSSANSLRVTAPYQHEAPVRSDVRIGKAMTRHELNRKFKS